jgi:hypothetical protein
MVNIKGEVGAKYQRTADAPLAFCSHPHILVGKTRDELIMTDAIL